MGILDTIKNMLGMGGGDAAASAGETQAPTEKASQELAMGEEAAQEEKTEM